MHSVVVSLEVTMSTTSSLFIDGLVHKPSEHHFIHFPRLLLLTRNITKFTSDTDWITVHLYGVFLLLKAFCWRHKIVFLFLSSLKWVMEPSFLQTSVNTSSQVSEMNFNWFRGLYGKSLTFYVRLIQGRHVAARPYDLLSNSYLSFIGCTY